MRDRGVTRARLPDGTELELGEAPRPVGLPRAAKSPEELARLRREHVDSVMFASSTMRPRTPG
jgi:hypothetical protein